MSSRFTQYILIAMALGIVMGTIVFNYMPDSRVEIAADVNLIAMLFLRLIKMIIAPLVFATLVGGIAHMGSGSKLGRVFRQDDGLVRQRLLCLAAARPRHGQSAAARRQLPRHAARQGAVDRPAGIGVLD
jgi:L-cystine uptake protein TcyP (sodium:dicarboxylate symporter family)